MALSPVVSSSRLTKDEVVRPEDLAVGTRSDGIHGARFEVNKDSPWDVLSSGGFVVINVDPFELKIRRSDVRSGRIDAMFVRNDLPELKKLNNVYNV